jgi:hypothetical protein
VGREGGQSERDITLNIWEVGRGEHGLRDTVAAAVTSDLGFGWVSEQDKVYLPSLREEEKGESL